MTPVELLNQMEQRRNEELNRQAAKGTIYRRTEWVDPSTYIGVESKVIGSQKKTYVDDRLEYLKDFIVDFLLNAHAIKQPDIVKGYRDAKGSIVASKTGYGEVDDIYYKVGGRKHRIRVLGNRPVEDPHEQIEKWQWEDCYGSYPVVATAQDFYNWYTTKFGPIDIPDGL